MEKFQITPEITLSVNQIKDAIKHLIPDEIFDAIATSLEERHITTNQVIDAIMYHFEDDIKSVDTERKELQHYKDSTCGLFVTDIAPEHLFEMLMSFRSDANPFSEDGECQVADGRRYIADMWSEFYKTVFFQLDGSVNARQTIAIMDDICAHSLDPESFNKWDEIKQVLNETRSDLKNP